MTLIDSHCHLDAAVYDADREAVIRRARDAGVECMVAIGSGDGPPDLEAGLRLAAAYDFIYATAARRKQGHGRNLEPVGRFDDAREAGGDWGDRPRLPLR